MASGHVAGPATARPVSDPKVDEPKHRKKVLHLVGSRYGNYNDLSVLYAKACDECPDLDRSRFEFFFAYAHVDGSWSFPEDLREASLVAAERFSLGAAVSHLTTMAPDVVMPHMFCVEGMERYRSLFGLLDIPFVGKHDYTVAPATDKATTKQLLGAAGVPVPRGNLLVKGKIERPVSVTVPFVVKPCNEDSSRGITLVRREEDAPAAIDHAFSFDPRVVVEEYIAGREVSVACIQEEDGSLTVLPKMEFFITDIRKSTIELAASLGEAFQAREDSDRKCPADLSPALHERIDNIVKEAHRIMKCRHYSLFDFRIDADEQPYILEAALFCSFSPLSIIPSMAQHTGRDDLRHPNLLHSLLERASADRRSRSA